MAKKFKVSELFKLLLILVVAGGLIVGLILAQQRQVVEKEARHFQYKQIAEERIAILTQSSEQQ